MTEVRDGQAYRDKWADVPTRSFMRVTLMLASDSVEMSTTDKTTAVVAYALELGPVLSKNLPFVHHTTDTHQATHADS